MEEGGFVSCSLSSVLAELRVKTCGEGWGEGPDLQLVSDSLANAMGYLERPNINKSNIGPAKVSADASVSFSAST